MYKKLEALGSSLLALFVPKVEAGACGSTYYKNFSACWQCYGKCGYNAPCLAECRSGCGCTVPNPFWCHC
jgi:hypothetical protein